MALTWEWKNLSGTITEINYGKEHTFNFYEGNALMIVLNEYKDENGEDVYLWPEKSKSKQGLLLSLTPKCDLRLVTAPKPA